MEPDAEAWIASPRFGLPSGSFAPIHRCDLALRSGAQATSSQVTRETRRTRLPLASNAQQSPGGGRGTMGAEKGFHLSVAKPDRR